jgi:hypothetical protein
VEFRRRGLSPASGIVSGIRHYSRTFLSPMTEYAAEVTFSFTLRRIVNFTTTGTTTNNLMIMVTLIFIILLVIVFVVIGALIIVRTETISSDRGESTMSSILTTSWTSRDNDLVSRGGVVCSNQILRILETVNGSIICKVNLKL